MDRRDFLKQSTALTALAATASLAACGQSEDTEASSAAKEAQTQKGPGSLADFARMDAHQIASHIRKGDMTAGEALNQSIAIVNQVNPAINAVVTPAFDMAAERAASMPMDGVLAGVPFLLKDLLDFKGVRCTQGSRLLLENVSETSAPLAEAFEAAGLNVMGKTNTPEFGLLATTEPLALGACRNPWNPEHSTGGSSGGSAAAVASGMVPMAQASDGGGSIRIPASCCGLFGLKPSRGRIVDNSSMPGEIGVRNVVSRTVRDSALAFSIGEDKGAGAALPTTGLILGPSDRRLKIAFATENYLGDEPDEDVRLALEETASLCESLGHEIIPAKNPVDGEAFINHFLTIWASGPSNLKAMVEQKTGAPAEETGLLEPWTLGLADYFNAKPDGSLAEALSYMARVTGEISEWMSQYDVWLTPVLKSAPPKIGEQAPTVPFETLYERTINYVSYTPLHNATGLPAMSVPLSWNAAGLPIGSQFAASLGQEATLLALAYELEEARPWKDKWAPTSAINL